MAGPIIKSNDGSTTIYTAQGGGRYYMYIDNSTFPRGLYWIDGGSPTLEYDLLGYDGLTDTLGSSTSLPTSTSLSNDTNYYVIGGSGGDTYTWAITSNGAPNYNYVEYNGTQHFAYGESFNITQGDQVRLYANFGSSGNKITINGIVVSDPSSGAASYTYIPQGNATVRFITNPGSNAQIEVTETTPPPPADHTVTLSNSCDPSYSYLLYNNTPYFTQGDTITVTSGTTVHCFADSPVSGGKIILNGTVVAQNSPATYNYSPAANATVTFSSDGAYQIITIVEGSSPTTKTCSITYKGVERANFEISSDVVVSYNGTTLATISEGTKTLKFNGDNFLPYNIIVGPKTIQCAGKLITSDITITVTNNTPWEDPVQDGSNLSITQVYNATQNGSNLILE